MYKIAITLSKYKQLLIFINYGWYSLNVISTLEDDSMTLINWFSINKMKANPEKFQAIALGKQTKQQNLKSHWLYIWLKIKTQFF